MKKYFTNIEHLERLTWSAMGSNNIVPIAVYDMGTYMVAPYPWNKELVNYYENELKEKRILRKHIYRIKKEDFDDPYNWTN